MPYDSRLALTNAQNRNQGMRGALDDFLGYFKQVRQGKDEAEKEALIKEISAAPVSAVGNGDGPAVGMDAAGMPTGLTSGAPAEAQAQHLAQAKAQYLMKYGQKPTTAADFLADDAMQGEQMAQIGDAQRKRAAGVTAEGNLAQFQKDLEGDATMTAADRSYLKTDPKAYAERFKPISQVYVAGKDGYVAAPGKVVPGAMPGAVTTLRDESGAVVKPIPKPVEKTPEQIEANAAAAARGKASVAKPITEEQQQTIQMKLSSLQTAKRQLQDVRKAFDGIKNAKLSGKGRGWVPTKENDSFTKSVEALKPTITALTRVPGIGSMSDFETRIAMAPYPNTGEYPEVNEKAIKALEDLINETETGYKGMGKGGGDKDSDPLGLGL
jgi:hypothetical protein